MPAHVKTAYDQSQPGPLEAIEKDAALGPIAANYIRTHPLEEARLALRKLWIFFTFDPSHEKGRSFIYWVPLVILNSLAEWGAFFRRSTLLSGNDLFLVVPIFFAIAISTVKFVLPSYKIAIDLFLMIIAANVFISTRGQSSPSNNSPCKSLEKLRIRHCDGTVRHAEERFR